MEKKINAKLQQVMDFIRNYTKENGYPPSVRDICSGIGVSSTATIYYYLTKLEEQGLLTKTPYRNRSIGIVDAEPKSSKAISVPLIGKISAGEPILAIENMEEVYPLPAGIFHGENLFMLRVKGDSMIEAGIFDGDYLVVQPQSDARHRDIVVALLGENTTVKRLLKQDGKAILHPENARLSDIVPAELEILGVVVGSLRKLC